MYSIIIPLYNKQQYIRKSLDSIFVQTYKDYEVIVVNDGSIDGSMAELKAYSEELKCKDQNSFEKLKIIEQKNQGVSEARNNGVKHSSNNYIAFLDADDWWNPFYLENMAKLIHKYPEAGIYGSSYYKVRYNNSIEANIGVDSEFECGYINYFAVYAKTMWMPLWTGATVVKKSVFDELGGFKRILKVGEDFDLWARIAIKYPVVFLNKPLAYYNQDVNVDTRASALQEYNTDEHMLFSDYSELRKNKDFNYLFECLALYGLLPSYLYSKNKKHVKVILSDINWENQPFKYRLYYRLIPRVILKIWFVLMKKAAALKRKIKLLIIR